MVVSCSSAVGRSSQELGVANEPGPENVLPEKEVSAALLSPLVRRLTRDEYKYTIEDVLGVSLDERDLGGLPADRPLEGFVNIATSQTSLPEHIRAYANLSDVIVGRLNMESLIADSASCRNENRACHQAFVVHSGRLLFRRPLASEEAERFVGLSTAVFELGSSFEESAAAVVKAMLQSPQFLYRLENEKSSENNKIEGYALASRLSYYLWASAPDDELYRAAEAGELAIGRPEYLQQVDRMLSDTEKLRRTVDRFLLDWARLESLPDPDGLRDEMVSAAVAFYGDHMLDRKEPVAKVFSASRIFLTPRLAENYDMPSQGPGIQAYDTPSILEGGGLLVQPAIIAGMTNADGGEIVGRGLFLLSQVFCGHAPEPPASFQDEIDAFVEAQPEDASQRAIAEARLKRTECASCHQAFDPLGYGFEEFDARGRPRKADAFGNVLKADGWIPGSLVGAADIAYDGLKDFMVTVGELPEVQTCLVKKNFEYALGRRLTSGQQSAVQTLGQTLFAEEGTYHALAKAIVSSSLFLEMDDEE